MGAICAQMPKEAMLFQKPFPVAHADVMALDKDAACIGFNHAGGGKWSWACAEDPESVAALRVDSQEFSHFFEG